MAKRAYGLGNSYRWCVVSFIALSMECKVLVVFNSGKQKFEAILGTIGSGALRVLCSYEYHPSEPGWHCHATCDDVEKVPGGYMRGPWVKRIPHAKRTHRRQELGITDEQSAQRFALKFYRIEVKGSLL
ncbi:hypothetical protein [Aquabacter spiritensis]|uniref:Uncharacterized protein n=1 Tax=Aquabacter spiritensis TaxID=933073 RepID=A0A4R3LZA3_9HYPH|nr:hypothetical protein [Aquabacter spiritensis]TCT05219.1 hypothetical protein EDC64_105250 [Aquabacter spiritensis]